jgi:hypothetical protein
VTTHLQLITIIILDLPQHVSASHCYHQGVVVTSEATQAISVLWMYMDYDQSRLVSCRGMYISRQLTTLDGPQSIYIHNTDIAWVTSEVPTTPWWRQWLAETCWGKSLSIGATSQSAPRPPSRVSSILPGLGRLLSSFYALALTGGKCRMH